MIHKQVKPNSLSKFGVMSFLLLMLTGCGGEVSGNTANQQSDSEKINSQLMTELNFEESGIFSGHLLLKENKTPIEYGLSIPEIPEGETVPLVLALHFSGGQGLPFLQSFALFGLADLDAIIISPSAPKGSNWTTISTTAMLKELVESAIKDWPVDPKKVVVMGYSMGGYGTWNLLSSSPELFSAAIPIASSPNSWLETISTGVPIYAIHSELDQQIPLSEVESEVLALQNKGVDIQLVVAKNIDHYDADILVTYLYDAMDWLKYTIWAE